MDSILRLFLSPEELERHKKKAQHKRLIEKIASTEKEKAIDILKEIMDKAEDREIRAYAAKHIDILEKKYYMSRYKDKAERNKIEEDKELLRKDLQKRDDKLSEIAAKIKEVFPEAVKDEKLAREIGEVLEGSGPAKKPLFPNLVLRFRTTSVILGILLLILIFSSIRESMITVKGVGKVRPTNMSNVQAEIEGKIEDMYVDEGSVVTKGQVIGLFEKKQFLTQFGTKESEGGQKEVGKAEAALKHAEEELARYKSLYEKESATRKQMEDAEFNLKYAKEEYDREVDNIKKCEIKAPLSGVVLTSKMKQKIGSYLKKGEFICTIADLTSLTVEVPIQEVYINKIHVGQKALAHFSAYPLHWFKGEVVVKEETVFEGKTVGDLSGYQFMTTVQLGKDIEKYSVKLKPGMTAIVKIMYR